MKQWLIDRVIEPIYDRTIRPHLALRLVVLNGVVRRQATINDPVHDHPEFKSALVDGIREVTRADDLVRDVGGGHGVATINAARCATDGEVVTYEPSHKQAAAIREAAVLNGVADRVTVEETAIGTPTRIYGEHSGEVRPAEELPPCDILVMDCEGSEVEILSDMPFNPRAVVCEVHPQLGVDTDDVLRTLDQRGYVTSLRDISDVSGNPIIVARLLQE